MRRDCLKCKYCYRAVSQNFPGGSDFPDGCGYGVDGSRPIGTRCYKDGKLLKKYQYMAKKQKREIPGEVSWRVVDAWLAIPPCNYKTDPYCHVQCPYFYECYPDEQD